MVEDRDILVDVSDPEILLTLNIKASYYDGLGQLVFQDQVEHPMFISGDREFSKHLNALACTAVKTASVVEDPCL